MQTQPSPPGRPRTNAGSVTHVHLSLSPLALLSPPSPSSSSLGMELQQQPASPASERPLSSRAVKTPVPIVLDPYKTVRPFGMRSIDVMKCIGLGGRGGQRLRDVLGVIFKTLGLLLSLYLFICSLTFLSTSFRILGGRNLSSLFSSSDVLSNPIIGAMIGILVTVLVQSSATSTSIIVSLVSAGVQVKHAVPMIFGSNIGTSVTNTIVSMTQAGDRECFRRAFAAATVHDMFNWLSVIVLLAVEVATGFLEKLTADLVERMPLGTEVSNPDLLKPLTKPFTNTIVQLDNKILLGWSFGDSRYDNVTSLLKTNCTSGNDEDDVRCTFLFALLGENGVGFSDASLGVMLLIASLLMLCACLIALMKILNSILSAKMATLIQNFINAEIPYFPWLTGYLAMLIGAVITILVRSSSVFTSTLTPLCGAGLVNLETAYPMTLGSNIGTTTTSILASLAAEGQYLKPSVQIALVHLFFNIVGILLFYPIPWMRWPIHLARVLGDTTAEYRWFAGLYLLAMFFLFPVFIFLLSLAGLWALYSALSLLTSVVLFALAVNLLQAHRRTWLPTTLQTWDFLPLWMHSWQPLDDFLSQFACVAGCGAAAAEEDDAEARKADDVEAAGRPAETTPELEGLVKKNQNGVVFIDDQRALSLNEEEKGIV